MTQIHQLPSGAYELRAAADRLRNQHGTTDAVFAALAGLLDAAADTWGRLSYEVSAARADRAVRYALDVARAVNAEVTA